MIATLVAAARAETANSLLLANGDFIQGNPLGDFMAYQRGLEEGDVRPTIRAMNELRFDAATLGNHEFDDGLSFLEKALSGRRFPFLLANLARGTAKASRRDDATLAPPYVILERELVDGDPSVQVVSNAQLRYVAEILRGGPRADLPLLSAAAPFKAGGRGGPDYYADVAPGPVASKNVADLDLYPNTVRAVLIDGVTCEIDVTQPAKYGRKGEVVDAAAERMRNLRHRGRPIDPARKFVVATNNYRAAGGGDFPGLDGGNIVPEAPDTNRDVLVYHIIEQKVIDPSADDNRRIAPIGGGAMLVFATGPGAEPHAAARSDIACLRPGDDGFARYALKRRR
jgi:2',3'-cyclic-nucleotide 2'-phosphodiesterase (5'-nucleotidase family)